MTAAVLAAIPVVLIGAAILYLKLADLSGWRDTVERLVSDALGRELKIAGQFEPEIGLTTRVIAGAVTLANPEWSSEPHMISVGRLSAGVELLPLLSGIIRIHDLEIEQARVVLESGGAGCANWQFTTAGEPSTEPGTPPEISVDSVRLRDVVAVYRDPALARPLELAVSNLEITSDDAGMLELRLAGDLNGAALGLGGRLGPLAGLISGGAVEHDLAGHLGDATIALKGRIQDLASLGGTDIQIDLEGTDLAEVGEPFGLNGLPAGPFKVAATASPAAFGSALSGNVTLGEMTARVDGTVDSLSAPAEIGLTVAGSGPDMAQLGAIAGLEGLPHDPFTVSGHARWQGFPIAFEDIKARVGDTTLALTGVLGAPPRLLDTDFSFRAAGPDLAPLGALLGLELPAGEFRIDGRLARVERGVRLERFAAVIGDTTLDVHGVVGDPPGFAGTELEVSARGPDLSAFRGPVGIGLPAEPFQVSGRLSPDGDAIDLEGVQATVGRNALRVAGRIAATPGFVGTDLTFEAEGPGLSWVGPITGLSGLPEDPYRAAGGLRIVRAGYQLESVRAELGELSLAVDGTIGGSPGLEGTNLRVEASGPDLSYPASFSGLEIVPRKPFRIAGTLRVSDLGYLLDNVAVAVGDAQATVEGRIGPLPNLHGTSLELRASGPRLSELEPFFERLALPAAPFRIAGGVGIEPDGYRLERVVAELADHRLEADGLLAHGAGLTGTHLTVSVAGPDLRAAGRMAVGTGLVELPELPAERYSVTGGVTIDDAGFALRAVDLVLGAGSARINGRVGHPPGLQGTDLTIDAGGPNASLLAALTGASLPAAPFRVEGHFERAANGYRIDQLRVQLGEHHLSAFGVLGEPPALTGTAVTVHADGPSLELVEQLSGIEPLPHQPFVLDGQFRYEHRRFAGDRFALRVGDDDLSGSFAVDWEGRPRIDATLRSDRISLAMAGAEQQDQETAPPIQERPPDRRRPMVFSDEPFELEALAKADAGVRWSIGELELPLQRLTDIEIDVVLADGRLRIGPLAASGARGGRLQASLVLEPAGADYRLSSKVHLEGARVMLSKTEADPVRWPTLDLEADVSGVGASPHRLASTLSGQVGLALGEGVMDDTILNLVTADVLVSLLEAVNPFAKSQPVSLLECGVVLVHLDQGVAVLDGMAVKTDKITLLGRGKLDLATEELDFQWLTKPRKGLGISASTITNPYMRLGGTLAKPTLEMKPLEGVTTTGVAVATVGLSILGKGMYDRITAGQEVCAQAIEKARRRDATRTAEEGR